MVTSATNVLFKQPKPIIVISPSAKGTTKVSEQFKNPHIKRVIAPEQSAGTSSPEPIKEEESKSERRRMSRGKKIGFGVVGAIAGVAIAVPATLGIVNSGENNNTSDAPQPNDRDNSEVVDGPAAPPEAKDFLDAYSDRYNDPLATYYAEMDYETESGGQSLTIGDEYIDGYDFSLETFQTGETSPLEFPILRLPLDVEVTNTTPEVTVNQFNESIPVMDRLLNLLAKNPTPEQVAVIRDEFVKFTGFENQNANSLVDKFLAITQQYGSESNYSINPASDAEDANSLQNTVFKGGDFVELIRVNEEGEVTAFSNLFDLSVNVETFDASGESATSTAVLEDVEYSVYRSDFDPGDVGLIGIGMK